MAFQLLNRRVLIVGGGNVAADRLRSVLPTGAKVTLVAPEDGMGEEVRYRVENKEEYGLEVRLREFKDGDITEEVSLEGAPHPSQIDLLERKDRRT